MARYRTALFLFRRDLRLDDNAGLALAAELGERVLPAFVFDPRQQPEANDHFSSHAFQFLLESLEDLEEQLAEREGKLYRFRGLPHEVVARLLDEPGEAGGVEAVFVNRDYTPFSRRRDAEIERVCAERNVYFHAASDLLLAEPGTVLTNQGEPYRTFTPFWRKLSAGEIREPRRLGSSAGFYRGRIPWSENKTVYRELAPETNPELHVRGGRSRGEELLARLDELGRYEETRDVPSEDGTTSLSAHHKFGTVSVRETWHALGDALGTGGSGAEPLRRELAWRDFFTHLAWFHPHVFGRPFDERYEAVEWDGDEAAFEAWQEGETGFPLVDAGMRQLAATGWMHNRVRMVTASFLTKDLHLDWRLGERHFARLLVDYDPSVNNGNWQWCASTGADAQPYFRIFNPWSQQERHDPDAVYVKRWVPELKGLSAKEIHGLAKERPEGLSGYPEPIVDHKREARRAQERFAEI